MATPFLESSLVLLKGDVSYLGILCWDETNPENDISTATAILTVYDETGTIVVSDTSCTVSGTTLLEIRALVDTSALSVGRMRCRVKVTLGTYTKTFQFTFRLDPVPAAQ